MVGHKFFELEDQTLKEIDNVHLFAKNNRAKTVKLRKIISQFKKELAQIIAQGVLDMPEHIVKAKSSEKKVAAITNSIVDVSSNVLNALCKTKS